MALQFRAVPKKAPGVDESGIKYYPNLTNREVADLRFIANLMDKRSSLQSADVYRMAEMLFSVIPELLQKGYNVKLGDFGTFSLSIKASGMDDAKKVTRKNIKEVRMNFLAGKLIKENLKKTEFIKIK